MILLRFLYLSILTNIVESDQVCSIFEVHALILARGGSKGLPYKNLRKLDGLSILARTIISINKTLKFEHIWVSTDSESIAEEALKYGALVHKRDAYYARDDTTSIDSIKEFLAVHNGINKFALFQCTSVFLRESYILKAFTEFQTKECVFAATRSFKLRWKELGDKIVPQNFNPGRRPRRQDWVGEFVETGMFYFTTRSLVEQGILQNENCGIIEVDNRDALEIDTIADMLLAECLINQQQIQLD